MSATTDSTDAHHQGTKGALMSPVPHILGSNAVPVGSEVQRIQNAIAEAEPRRQWLGNEIEQVLATLNQLREEYQSVSTYVENHKALLSPARRLCPELWSGIFAQCIPKPLTGTSSFDPDHPPYVFLRVCRAWKHIALSTPELWATISISAAGTKAFCQKSLTRFWLTQSKSHPLSIYLSLYPVPPGGDCQGAIDELILHCRRWETVHISLPSIGEADFYAKLSAVKNNLPLLRELAITLKYRSIHSFDIFEIAPRLSAVLCGFGVPISEVCLPWNQLTHWSTMETTVTDFLEVLRLCPELVDTKIVCSEWGQHDQLPVRIEHPRLRSLRLSMYQGSIDEDELHVFNRITFSALQELELRFMRIRAPGPFLSFLSRSAQCLKSFVLDSVFVLGEELIEFLRVLPSVTHIEFRNPMHSAFLIITDELFHHLAFKRAKSGDQPSLAPQLQSIVIHGSGPFTDTAFASMVESRWRWKKWHSTRTTPGLCRLRYAELVLHREVDQNVVLPLKELKTEGLMLKVQEYTKAAQCYRSVL